MPDGSSYFFPSSGETVLDKNGNPFSYSPGSDTCISFVNGHHGPQYNVASCCTNCPIVCMLPSTKKGQNIIFLIFKMISQFYCIHYLPFFFNVGCPEGSIEFENKCYRSTEFLPWEVSINLCIDGIEEVVDDTDIYSYLTQNGGFRVLDQIT